MTTTADALAADIARQTELHAAAKAQLADRKLYPTTSHAIAQYVQLTSSRGPANYGADMADLFARCIPHNPELARLLLSAECLEDIAAAAARNVSPGPDETYAAAGDRVGREACDKYLRAVAAHIVAAGDHPLADAARQLLAAAAELERLAAEQAKLEEAERARAVQLELERRAASRAADEVADQAALEVELAEVLRRHGLPTDLRTGMFVDRHRERLGLLVAARRRLRATRVDAIRLDLGQGRGLYSCAPLAASITDFSVAELKGILGSLDQAEGGAPS